MTDTEGARHRVDGLLLRAVREDDLPTFFEHQQDSTAVAMAAVAAREDDEFATHWSKILADPNVITRTVVIEGQIAGNVVSWLHGSKRLVGYWIGRDYWGEGVATRALAYFVAEVAARPLYAHVAEANVASFRVLEKCGFTFVRKEPAEDVVEIILRLD